MVQKGARLRTVQPTAGGPKPQGHTSDHSAGGADPANWNFAQFVLDLLLSRVAISPNEVFNFDTSASMSVLICTAVLASTPVFASCCNFFSISCFVVLRPVIVSSLRLRLFPASVGFNLFQQRFGFVQLRADLLFVCLDFCDGHVSSSLVRFVELLVSVKGENGWLTPPCSVPSPPLPAGHDSRWW